MSFENQNNNLDWQNIKEKSGKNILSYRDNNSFENSEVEKNGIKDLQKSLKSENLFKNSFEDFKEKGDFYNELKTNNKLQFVFRYFENGGKISSGIDGNYGKSTALAVAFLQFKNKDKLKVDGIFGKNTDKFIKIENLKKKSGKEIGKILKKIKLKKSYNDDTERSVSKKSKNLEGNYSVENNDVLTPEIVNISLNEVLNKFSRTAGGEYGKTTFDNYEKPLDDKFVIHKIFENEMGEPSDRYKSFTKKDKIGLILHKSGTALENGVNPDRSTINSVVKSASVQFVITRNGTVIQTMPIEKGGGGGSDRYTIGGMPMNGEMIGVEFAGFSNSNSVDGCDELTEAQIIQGAKLQKYLKNLNKNPDNFITATSWQGVEGLKGAHTDMRGEKNNVLSRLGVDFDYNKFGPKYVPKSLDEANKIYLAIKDHLQILKKSPYSEGRSAKYWENNQTKILSYIAGFNGEKKDYSDLFKKYKNIPSEFKNALNNSDFKPSKDELKIFLNIAKQESGFNWDPKIDWSSTGTDGIKKQKIKEKLDKLNSLQNGVLTSPILKSFLDDNEELKLLEITNGLQSIYKNKNTTEYDVYMWSRKFSTFLKSVEKKHSNFIAVSGMLGINNLSVLKDDLNHTPDTFGLWQINVDFFMEKVKKDKSFLTNTKLINLSDSDLRHELVLALLGKSESKISKQEVMNLTINNHLKPRYENHKTGNSEDLKMMAVENLTGEMSTYYTAIQDKLNNILNLKPELKLDGDLGIFKKYSTEIDWDKTENNGTTYAALKKYVEKNNLNKNSIKGLLTADSWRKLQNNELYKKIIGEDFGKRIVPKIKSVLFAQSAESYADKIV